MLQVLLQVAVRLFFGYLLRPDSKPMPRPARPLSMSYRRPLRKVK
jgi:hypothetical protein